MGSRLVLLRRSIKSILLLFFEMLIKSSYSLTKRSPFPLSFFLSCFRRRWWRNWLKHSCLFNEGDWRWTNISRINRRRWRRNARRKLAWAIYVCVFIVDRVDPRRKPRRTIQSAGKTGARWYPCCEIGKGSMHRIRSTRCQGYWQGSRQVLASVYCVL